MGEFVWMRESWFARVADANYPIVDGIPVLIAERLDWEQFQALTGID